MAYFDQISHVELPKVSDGAELPKVSDVVAILVIGAGFLVALARECDSIDQRVEGHKAHF